MKTSDTITICSALVALSGAISEPLLDALTGGHGPYASTVLVTVGIVAGVIIRVLTNKTGSPATSIVENAPVVSQGTAVTTPENIIGTNVHS